MDEFYETKRVEALGQTLLASAHVEMYWKYLAKKYWTIDGFRYVFACPVCGKYLTSVRTSELTHDHLYNDLREVGTDRFFVAHACPFLVGDALNPNA